MNKTMRSVVMAGLGVLATAGAATPALASAGTTGSAAKPSAGAVQQYLPYGTEVVGYYATLTACNRAALIGGTRGFWEVPSCAVVPVGVVGVRTGAYALQVGLDDCNWGAVGFQSFYRTQAFRFAGDGFLGYSPRWRTWVNRPAAFGPFGFGGGLSRPGFDGDIQTWERI